MLRAMYVYPHHTAAYMWRPAELEHVSGQLRVKEEECAALQEALAREVAAVSSLQALLQYYMCPHTTMCVSSYSDE